MSGRRRADLRGAFDHGRAWTPEADPAREEAPEPPSSRRGARVGLGLRQVHQRVREAVPAAREGLEELRADLHDVRELAGEALDVAGDVAAAAGEAFGFLRGMLEGDEVDQGDESR